MDYAPIELFIQLIMKGLVLSLAILDMKLLSLQKQVVMTAYKRVKANKGSAGIDGQDINDFETNLKKNLYKICNRMSSGSYFHLR